MIFGSKKQSIQHLYIGRFAQKNRSLKMTYTQDMGRLVGNIEVLGFLKKRDAYNLIERFGDHKSDLSILKIEHHRRRGAINALNVLDRIHWEDGAKVRLYKEE